MAIWYRGWLMIDALIVGRKVYFWVDCRGASVSDGVGCRARWRATGASFPFQGSSPSVALDVHLEDGGVVDEPVDHGQRHGWVGEDLAPLTERLVCGDEDGAAFVAGADELEQDAGLGLVLADIGEVVEDQEVEAVEPVDGGLEGEFAAGDLQLLDEVGGPGEQDPCSVVDHGKANGCSQVAFSAAGWAEQEQVGTLGQPAVAGGDGYDLRLGEHRHGLEVESIEGLSGRQARLGEMAFDPPAAPFGEFVFGDGGEEACGGPSFLVRLFSDLRPHQLDGGQAQLVEQEADARAIDGLGGLHATAPL